MNANFDLSQNELFGQVKSLSESDGNSSLLIGWFAALGGIILVLGVIAIQQRQIIKRFDIKQKLGKIPQE